MRKKNEKTLANIDPFGQDLFQTSDGMMLTDLDGKVIVINDIAKQIWNLDKAICKGSIMSEIMNAASLRVRDKKTFLDRFLRTIESKNSVSRLEIPLIDGIVVDCHTFPMIGSDNKVHGRIWYTRDITEQKRVQDLRNLQHLMMENLGEGIVLETVSDSRIVYTNKRFEKMFGYNRNELIGKHISILSSPPDDETPTRFDHNMKESIKNTGEWCGVVKNVKKCGTPMWTEVKTVGIDHSQYGEVYVSIQEDVTEKIKADKLLQESEKRYRVLFEYSEEAILFITKEGEILDANPAAQKLTGYSLVELKKIGRSGLIDPLDDRINKLLELRDKYAYYRGNFRIVKSDGKNLECEAASVVFRDKNGYEQTHIVLREVVDKKK